MKKAETFESGAPPTSCAYRVAQDRSVYPREAGAGGVALDSHLDSYVALVAVPLSASTLSLVASQTLLGLSTDGARQEGEEK